MRPGNVRARIYSPLFQWIYMPHACIHRRTLVAKYLFSPVHTSASRERISSMWMRAKLYKIEFSSVGATQHTHRHTTEITHNLFICNVCTRCCSTMWCGAKGKIIAEYFCGPTEIWDMRASERASERRCCCCRTLGQRTSACVKCITVVAAGCHRYCYCCCRRSFLSISILRWWSGKRRAEHVANSFWWLWWNVARCCYCSLIMRSLYFNNNFPECKQWWAPAPAPAQLGPICVCVCARVHIIISQTLWNIIKVKMCVCAAIVFYRRRYSLFIAFLRASTSKNTHSLAIWVLCVCSMNISCWTRLGRANTNHDMQLPFCQRT